MPPTKIITRNAEQEKQKNLAEKKILAELKRKKAKKKTLKRKKVCIHNSIKCNDSFNFFLLI